MELDLRPTWGEAWNPLEMSPEETHAYMAPFHNAQVCQCGIAFPLVRPWGAREVCGRCGILRPEKLSHADLRQPGMQASFAIASSGQPKAWPVWHPIAVPTQDLTEYLTHPRVAKKFKKAVRPLLPPPRRERPHSATSSAAAESFAIGLSRPMSAGMLRLLKASEDSPDRIMGGRSVALGTWQNPSSRVMLTNFVAPSKETFSTWTPGRFLTWIDATHERRINGPRVRAEESLGDSSPSRRSPPSPLSSPEKTRLSP